MSPFNYMTNAERPPLIIGSNDEFSQEGEPELIGRERPDMFLSGPINALTFIYRNQIRALLNREILAKVL